jgi:hypothetical protein
MLSLPSPPLLSLPLPPSFPNCHCFVSTPSNGAAVVITAIACGCCHPSLPLLLLLLSPPLLLPLASLSSPRLILLLPSWQQPSVIAKKCDNQHHRESDKKFNNQLLSNGQ